MINKIDIKNYELNLIEKQYDKIFEELSEKTIELASEILKIKDLEVSKEQLQEDMFIQIKVMIQRYFGVFREMSFLIDYLMNWDDTLIYTSKEKNVQIIVEHYNLLVDILNNYITKEAEIKEKGFEILCNECEQKLKKLYIEMLLFKNKDCSEDETLKELTKKVVYYYNFLYEDIYNAESALNGAFIEADVEKPEITLNQTEIIVIIEGLINYLTPSETNDGYKAYADC